MSEKIPDSVERFGRLMERLSSWDASYLASNGRYDYAMVLDVKNLVLDAYEWGKANGREDAIRESCSRAGSATSITKAYTSSQNGRLGGRPRKEKNA